MKLGLTLKSLYFPQKNLKLTFQAQKPSLFNKIQKNQQQTPMNLFKSPT